MQIQFQALAQHSVHQIRDTMRRVSALRVADARETGNQPRHTVEVPKPDAVAWEDTEIDVRRVVL